MPNLVNDAALNLRLRQDGVDGIGKAGQSIDTGNENVLDPARLQVSDHTQPEVGAFSSGADPVSPHISVAFQIDAKHCVDGCVLDFAFPA